MAHYGPSKIYSLYSHNISLKMVENGWKPLTVPYQSHSPRFPGIHEENPSAPAAVPQVARHCASSASGVWAQGAAARPWRCWDFGHGDFDGNLMGISWWSYGIWIFFDGLISWNFHGNLMILIFWWWSTGFDILGFNPWDWNSMGILWWIMES